MNAGAWKCLVFGVTLSTVVLPACTTEDAEPRVITLLEVPEGEAASREQIAMHLRERQFTLLLVLARGAGVADGIVTEGFHCALLGPRDSTGHLRTARYASIELGDGECPHSTNVRLADIRVVAVDSATAATEVNVTGEAVQVRTTWQQTEDGWKASRMLSINNNDLRVPARAASQRVEALPP